MNGCVVQPHHRRCDRSLLIALTASVCVHLMGGFAGTRVEVDTSDSAIKSRRHAWEVGGTMLLDFAPDEPPVADREPPKPPDSSTEPPPPKPFWEAAAEPPKPIELTLGIDGSKHQSDNMIGFREPTPHSARQSQVDQPALDENAGSVDASAMAEGTPGALPGETHPAVAGAESSAAAPTGPTNPVPPTPLPPRPETLEVNPALPPDPVTKPGADTKPGDSAVEQDEIKANPTPPGVVSVRLPESPDGPIGGEATQPPQPKATQGSHSPNGEAAPVESLPAPAPAPATPLTGVPGDSGKSPKTMSSQDQPGKTPGIKSDKEADASSKNKPIEVRFGQTVASDGVEIVTKRPRQPLFTKLTRVIAYPDNPTLEATFDASGKVTDVKLLRSSGFEDVDDPVINMVFSWRARGPKLAEMSAGDPKRTFKLKFVILLR